MDRFRKGAQVLIVLVGVPPPPDIVAPPPSPCRPGTISMEFPHMEDRVSAKQKTEITHPVFNFPPRRHNFSERPRFEAKKHLPDFLADSFWASRSMYSILRTVPA